MRISIVAAALPPKLDGIGDYTAQVSAELSKQAQVTILVPHGTAAEVIPGVAIQEAFSLDRPGGIRTLQAAVAADPPDWLLLQYNPFSYGRWGFCPYLAQELVAARRRSPGTRLAVMMHETFVPFLSSENWKFAVMTHWQRRQFRELGQAADVLFFSIDPWRQQFERWFPGKPVRHLPVGSNIPHVPFTREEARRRLSIEDDTLVLGIFGTAHPSRLLPWCRQAILAVCQEGHKVLALHIGPDSDRIRQALDGVPVRADGPLPAEEVSRRFAAMDLCLAPFADGASTRRTSLMTGLQHGIATVSTCGQGTDTMLQTQEGQALLLTDARDPAQFCAQVLRIVQDSPWRIALGQAGQELYEREFAWPRIAERLLADLSFASPKAGR